MAKMLSTSVPWKANSLGSKLAPKDFFQKYQELKWTEQVPSLSVSKW